MDQERYVRNCFQEYDHSELLEDADHLIPKYQDYFITQIGIMFTHWQEKYTFEKNDTSVYTGAGGAALLYLKLCEANLDYKLKIDNDVLLKSSKNITKLCLKYMKANRYSFLCGTSGTLTIKCLLNSLLGRDYKPYLTEIANIANTVCQNVNLPDEVLYGRSGVLFCLLLLRSKLNDSIEIISDQVIQSLVNGILKSGQETSRRERSSIPLVFYWHEKAYIGAAHGYAGILHCLLQARHYMTEEQTNRLVKPTVDFVQQLQFAQTGNFPSSLSNEDDRLVHWCHGSPGVIHLLILAYQVFGDTKYLNAAVKSANDIWTRGLLKKGTYKRFELAKLYFSFLPGFGICHGVAGNGYAFLRLFQLTHDQKYLYRAIKFGEWCCGDGQSYVSRIADRPYSLFEGLAGTVFYLTDLLNPKDAKFPAFQI